MIPLLIYELLIFATIQLFGLLVGYRLSISEQFVNQVVHFSVFNFVIAFLIATAFFFIFLKFLKGAKFFKILFVFVVLAGSKVTLSAFFSNIVASVLTIVVLVIWLAFPFVLTHNFAMLMALSGIGASVGIGLTPGAVIILLSILSVYDVIAVYKTKHMVKMFNKLLSNGVVMSIIVPKTKMASKAKVKVVQPGGGFMLLGTGDIAFPLIFAVSALQVSLISSFFVIGGALVGVILVNQLLVKQAVKRAIPALPPIAICSILGYLASVILI